MSGFLFVVGVYVVPVAFGIVVGWAVRGDVEDIRKSKRRPSCGDDVCERCGALATENVVADLTLCPVDAEFLLRWLDPSNTSGPAPKGDT